MKLMILPFVLAFSAMTNTIEPSDKAFERVNESFTYGKQLTLTEVCTEADSLVLCSAERVGESYIDGLDGSTISQKILNRLSDLTRTDYKLTVHASFKGELQPGDTLTVSLPGGEFGRHTVDFGFGQLESDFDDYYLLPLEQVDGEYVPMLCSSAKLSDFWDMDGNGAVNFDADKLETIEPLGISGGYGEFESSIELFEAIEEAVGVSKLEITPELRESVFEKYRTKAEFTTLDELYAGSDEIILAHVDKISACLDALTYKDPATGEEITEMIPHTRYNITVFDGVNGQLTYFNQIELTIPGGTFNGIEADFGLASLEYGFPQLYKGGEYVIPLRIVDNRYVPLVDYIAKVGLIRDLDGDGLLLFENDEGALVSLTGLGLYDNVELSDLAKYGK